MYATETSRQCARPSARLSLTRQHVPAACQIAPYPDPVWADDTHSAPYKYANPGGAAFRARPRPFRGRPHCISCRGPSARTHARCGKRSATGAVSVRARRPEAASPGAGRGEARALARRLGHSGDERRSGIADARGALRAAAFRRGRGGTWPGRRDQRALVRRAPACRARRCGTGEEPPRVEEWLGLAGTGARPERRRGKAGGLCTRAAGPEAGAHIT